MGLRRRGSRRRCRLRRGLGCVSCEFEGDCVNNGWIVRVLDSLNGFISEVV